MPRPRPFVTGDHRLDGGWLLAAIIVNAVLWAFVAGGVVWLGFSLLRRPGGRRGAPRYGARFGPPPSRSPALDDLDLRYARGEISRDEYLGRRLDLIAALVPLSWGPPPAWSAPPPGPAPDAPESPPSEAPTAEAVPGT